MISSCSNLVTQVDSTSPHVWIKPMWKKLCGYTHGGPEQLFPRLDDTGLRANYPLQDILQAVRWSNFFQLFAGVEIASAAGNVLIGNEFRERKEWEN